MNNIQQAERHMNTNAINFCPTYPENEDPLQAVIGAVTSDDMDRLSRMGSDLDALQDRAIATLDCLNELIYRVGKGKDGSIYSMDKHGITEAIANVSSTLKLVANGRKAIQQAKYLQAHPIQLEFKK